MGVNMEHLVFERKVIKNHGSLQVTVPSILAKIMDLKKGDSLEIRYNPDGSFTCRKKVD